MKRRPSVRTSAGSETRAERRAAATRWYDDRARREAAGALPLRLDRGGRPAGLPARPRRGAAPARGRLERARLPAQVPPRQVVGPPRGGPLLRPPAAAAPPARGPSSTPLPSGERGRGWGGWRPKKPPHP